MNSPTHTINWVTTKFGDVVELVNGRAYKQNEMLSSGTPILRIQNLNGGSNWFYSDINLPSDKYCLDGDLLYAWSATFGPYIYKGPKAIFHYHIWNVKPTEAINLKFTFYELQRITDTLKRSAHGVAMPHITKSGMEAWPLELPPLAEQQRIADKLDTVLARVESCRERLARVTPLLKRFRQSVLAAATSGKLTEDWRVSCSAPKYKELKLGEVIRVSSGKGLTAKQMVSTGNIPVFGGNGVNGYHNEANTTEPTLVIGRVGYYCGSIHLTPEFAWVTDNALIVRHDENTLKRFLFIALQAINLRENDASTAQPVISGHKIYGIPFKVPSIAEQTEIVRRVETLFAFADRLEARLATAHAATERLTPALLAKAFRGELVPQDPNDEPAAELLKRIQAQRASQSAPSKKRAARKT